MFYCTICKTEMGPDRRCPNCGCAHAGALAPQDIRLAETALRVTVAQHGSEEEAGALRRVIAAAQSTAGIATKPRYEVGDIVLVEAKVTDADPDDRPYRIELVADDTDDRWVRAEDIVGLAPSHTGGAA